MRPASSSAVKWMSVPAILLSILVFANIASAQSGKVSDEKLSQQALPAHPVAAIAQTQLPKNNLAKNNVAPPPVTTDTWNGGGGSNTDWSDAANWNNGAIGSGYNILINTSSAATTVDQSLTIGTLTLSNSGDSASLNNNVQLSLGGNVSNAGTITFNGNGNLTGFDVTTALTLSGSGTLVLAPGASANTDYIYGTGDTTFTNASKITGVGTIGNGQLNLVNSGTINANLSGDTLTINPDACTGCTSINTGTLESTNGGILTLSGSTWSNTGGTIAAGTGSAVNLQNNVTINGGTLTTSGTGVIYNDSGSGVFLNNVTNSGAYVMQNNGLTEISGTITNTGTMTVEGNGNTTGLYLTGNATLTGSGSVTLQNSGSATNYIYGVAGSVLTNQQTIQGVGNVGNGELMIANASKGIINANVSGATLTLQSDTALTSTNAGLLEATNGGVLTLNNGTWTNTGTIEAQTGSTVNLYSNVSITGGTIESTGAGVVNNVTGSDVFLTGLTLAGTYNVQNNAITEINGTITNNGTITLQGNGNLTGLYVTSAGTGSATLAGTGTVVMATGNGGNQIYGVGGTSLTIEENISGVGNIGAADLTLTNSATINANISPTVSTAPLYIQPGAGGMTNTGVLEATNGGNLTLDGGTFTNTGGTIEAVGSDSSNNPSTVVLTNNVGITGGTLTTTGAGVIEVASGNQANLTGLTISSGSLLNVINNGEINTNGTITNNGTITLEGAGNSTYLYAPTSTTLTGTGSVVLTSGNGSYTGIVETAGGQTLTNKETISGAGTIQEGSIVNNGTINANISGQTLTLYDFTAATNTKTMEASGGGTLAFDGSTWTNTGGTIAAVTGSAVDLYASTSITGGTLTTTGTGQIYIPGGNQANLTSLTISSGSVLNVNNNGELNTNGTITNNGTITLQGAGNSTYLYAPTSTTLTGTGSVVLTSTNGDYTGIVDTAGGQTLTNNETISGAGLIEGGNIANNGTINAGVNGETLTLYNFTTATNTKTLEATNGGTLAFEGSSWTQTGVGTMTAQTGSSIELYSNATISGGTLTTAGTGQFYVPGGNTAYLSNLTNSGTFNVENNAELELTGTITNNGSFNVSGNGNATYLLINGAVTLKGTGVISLGGTSYTNSIYGEGTAPILTSFNTIEGAGNLGSSNMGFTNDGTVDANIAGQAIAINVNSSGFTNYNGTTTTLTGGTYIANGGNITFAAGNATGITTLAATVVEEGGGQMLNTSNSSGNALANLTSITSAGSFTTNVNFADAGAFSNAGSLTILGSTTFKVGSLTQISAGSLTAGTYVLDSNLDITGTAQTITANAANLTLAGGTIENTSNSTNALAGLATNTGKLTLANNAAFATTAASFSNTGTLTVNAGSTFIAPALTQISGTTLSGGTWVLGGNIDLNSGISITANASTLTLEGGTINSGSTNALAGLDSNTRILTLADSANFTATAATFSNAGELVVNSGSTFTANALSQYKTSQNALSGGTFVIGGTLAFAAGANGIEVLSSNLTLEGTGNIKNTTNNSNALAGLNNIVAAGSFTLADDANFTTAANLTNSGKLIIDSGSTFSVAGTLSNLSGGTLTGGTYTVGGTLQLTSANGGITTNAAALTLSGTTAKILDGTGNALSTFNNNTGSLTLSADATLETAASTFTNSGTVDVAKGSTLEVGGTTFGYSQSAGTTTVDGTVIGKGTAGFSVTGGTVQGAGAIKANVSIGGSGTTPTINVGDAGKAGLLSITGTYTQLSTATMNVSIGGTAVGTQYSQLKVSGTASLGGTLTAALINSFTPTVGQTFTILTAKSVSGTFTNTTIAINSSEHFAISYTSTGVVLTVVSGPASEATQPAAQTAVAAATRPASEVLKLVSGSSTLRHRVNTGMDQRIILASSGNSGDRHILPVGVGTNTLRVWDHVPVAPSWDHIRGVVVAQVPQSASLNAPHSDLSRHINNWQGQSQAVPVRAPLSGWAGVSATRLPVQTLKPSLPPVRW